MKTKHLLLIIFLWFLIAFCHGQDTINSQYIKYQMKFQGIETRAEAKVVWDNIRYYFNEPNNPFYYRLDFTDLYYFEIVVPYNKSDVDVREYFESKNMILIEYNKYYYE